MNQKTQREYPMTPKTFHLAILPLCLISAFAYAADTVPTEPIAAKPARHHNHDQRDAHSNSKQENASSTPQNELETVYVTAERQLQQSLGVSRISKQDLDTHPVINDVSELVRTMPGVNLTGNTTSGSFGNKRQIDIRGMGPENTLILIDGKPVTARNNERMTRNGERNTRGDSNWVPAEAIESIQVLRGPAAARYGSGAMGGVVNIITKKTTNDFEGSVNFYTNQPQDSAEGATNRVGFNLSGPIIKDVLSYRIYGNYNKTDADDVGINKGYNDNAAGVEGVRNKDLAGRLYWKISPSQSLTLDSSFSRQSNIYNGDTQYSNANSGLSNPDSVTSRALNGETARLYRSSASLTHDGSWEWGDTKTYIQFDQAKNSRMPVNLTGGVEGIYNALSYTDSMLTNYHFNHESYVPFETGRLNHVATIGVDALHTKLDDAASNSQATYTTRGGVYVDHGTIDGMGSNRSGKTSQSEYAVYVEDNIRLGKTTLIPMLRLDYSSKFGNNWSPALNFSYDINDNWLVKGGIARAYKTPNLYQSNTSYFLYSTGNGCNGMGNCYLQGNDDLKPETSINKEIGLEYHNDAGYQASLAYFHNDYHDKISNSSTQWTGKTTSNGYAVFQWLNIGRAVVEGLEGNFTLPLIRDRLKWNNNFTYMRRSIDKSTGEALSLIPKYTLNSTLNWTPNEKFDANLTYTYYGRQSASLTYAEQQSSTSNRTEVPRYGLMGFNVGYKFNKAVSGRMGMSNLFDKQIYRSGNGANTYNEHGRAFYGSLKVNF